MLLAQARKLRRFVSTETEYKLRRTLNAILPVKHRCANDIVFHACVWKTASQWVRVVLSDPRIYRYSGLSVVLSDEYLKPDPTQSLFPDRSIAAAMMRSYDFFSKINKPNNHFAFFVKRDPRDLVVSFYFSNRYSHRPNEKLDKERQVMADMSEKEGLMYTVGQFNKFVSILTSWEEAAKADNRIRIVRYEDLTGGNHIDVWHQLLNAADIRIPRDALADILETYSFDKITGGREKGVEVKTEKYRKGIAGDWVNYFDDELMTAFRNRYGNLPEKLGYEG